MGFASLAAALAVLFPSAGQDPVEDPLTRPIAPEFAARWMTRQTPLRIHGDTYYVGPGALSVVLIDTGSGLVLIDGALPQTVATVEANIRALGFQVEDIRYILNTEAHYDHSGGLAALARDSGATVVASLAGVEALRRGRALEEDPQFASLAPFAAVGALQSIGDGETLTLGRVAITAHATPGHTPGSASWSWRSCQDGTCRSVVFGSSLNPVASGGFRFTDHPEVVTGLRASIAKVEALPCDILISAHPDNSALEARLKAGVTGEAAFVDPEACRIYGARAQGLLETRLARETAPQP